MRAPFEMLYDLAQLPLECTYGLLWSFPTIQRGVELLRQIGRTWPGILDGLLAQGYDRYLVEDLLSSGEPMVLEATKGPALRPGFSS